MVISVIRIKLINARLELLARIAVSHQLTFTLGLCWRDYKNIYIKSCWQWYMRVNDKRIHRTINGQAWWRYIEGGSKTQSFSNIYHSLLINCSFGQKPTLKNFKGPHPSGSLLTGHALFLRAPYTAKINKIGHFHLKMSRYNFETNLLKYKSAEGIEFIWSPKFLRFMVRQISWPRA